MGFHTPVTTLAELDALDDAQVYEGYRSAERGDPEPGGNHSRSFYHGWRAGMMDLGEIEAPENHVMLVRGTSLLKSGHLRRCGFRLLNFPPRRFRIVAITPSR